jgi:tetratricopeptide (TPR) repeat protein
VHKIVESLKALAAIATVGAFLSAGVAHYAYAQGGQAQPQKKVKDQGEFDLYDHVVKETDPAKKLQYLNQWVEKYPETDYQEEQLRFYDQLGQSAKVLELGQKILGKDPKNLIALTSIASNIQKLPNSTPDQLAMGQKSAQTLLDNLDSLKPSTVTDDQWKQVKPQLEAVAKATIEWVVTKPARDVTEKKDWAGAETAWTKLVQQYPDNGQYSYQLASAIVSEKDPNKYPMAIYETARALEIGGIPAQNRQQVEAYLNKIYSAYHGPDDEDLKKLRQLAKGSALPPADFKIKTSAEIAAEKEEEFKTKNPQLALWMSIRRQLTDANGDQYFESAMKGSALPKLKGTLVDAKPACRSKELVVALSDATHPEVTLKLEMPLTIKPELGTEIQFDKGAPTEFDKNQFNLTMEAEKDNIEGLKGEPCAAPKAAPKGGVKKGVAPKKKAE